MSLQTLLIALFIVTPIALLFIRLSGGWKNTPWPHPSPDEENPYRRWKK